MFLGVLLHVITRKLCNVFVKFYSIYKCRVQVRQVNHLRGAAFRLVELHMPIYHTQTQQATTYTSARTSNRNVNIIKGHNNMLT